MSNKPHDHSAVDDAEQSKRFIELAKEVGADESNEGFNKAFAKVAKLKSITKMPDEP